MHEEPTLPAYDALRKLLSSAGGEMTWKPGGSLGGGSWNLTLHGRTFSVEARDNSPNLLDWLHVPTVTRPTTWGQFGDLKEDAFWRLIALFMYRANSD